MSEKINCPKCGYQIPIDEAIVQRAVDLKVRSRLDEEKNKLEITLKKDFEQNQNLALKKMEEKLEVEEKKRHEAEQKELSFIKKQTELEDKIQRQDLEIARKMQQERKLIIEKTQKESEEKSRLQIEEMRKQLDDTKKALTEAQRKAHQGSMQTQGEVLETTLEETLKQNFPFDKIRPVPKGISGADIIQTVYNGTGLPVGIIVWESKRTKNWTEDWVQKLKDDSRNIKASLCVLVSEILPKDINHIGQYNGVWLCDFASVVGLTTALRNQLNAAANAIVASTGKDQKMEALYSYFTSNTFAQRVEAIVETFMNMKTNLDKEKIAMQRIWASREMQITRLVDNTTKMHGEIAGIAGKSLPGIELLELGAGTEEKPEKDSPKKDSDQSALFA